MKTLIFVTILSLLTTAGCGPLSFGTHGDPTDVKDTKAKTMATDEVKLIVMGIETPMEKGTYSANTYLLSSTSRLLVRLGAMKSLATDVLDEQPVLLRVAPAQATDVTIARTEIKLCPLLSNWMMYATWKRAHPYRNGEWLDGGNIDSANCIRALPENSPLLANPEESNFCSSQTYLCFDIRPYLISYVRSRNINYGWALVSDSKALEIFGDATLKGPEMFYRQLRK